jgi:uncharacterized membrane protein
MAQTTVVGKATIYNIDGTVAYTGVVDNAGTGGSTNAMTKDDNFVQSIGITDEVDMTELRDAKGNVQGYDLYNHRRTATLEIIPIGSTVDNAASHVILPLPGAAVQVAEVASESSTEIEMPGLAIAAAAASGSAENAIHWTYIGGGSVTLSNTDTLRISLPCRLQNADSATTAHTGMGIFDTESS